ncbi:F-box protein CPR1-like [Salvia miltiorrhiza]|uniref:F-box protein CPR1-like n=1 Tax=Salvia miltiorrhiza TaxID=226208 RepID=UPI0025AC1B76|nr:F-box protein CPR1-like [Salvia miltiorrhiza]XP_057795030.1 F-box protein CPR1-like [Salvia miltiorrhiza]XP_057795031.1 F-box protein CPR1-like [Salvia miltiorrhiza]XP_057795032.1 F-box protein CPR1-like [Salvia miltiorrhiza]
MPNLPFELVEDILRRLPVKSLKRFRAVAKAWCSLIDSENFIKLHLRQSLISISNRNLIIGGLGVYSVDMEALDRAHVIKPPFYYKSVDGISNSCNGIVLVMSDPPVLWNPFSRDYRILPNCSTELQAPFESYGKVAYGFGYDPVSDDYKVVRVAEFRHKITHIWMASETKIYALRSNSWRRIGDFPYPLPFLRGNWRVHVNGAMHTLVEDLDEMDGAVAVIMAFDLRSEKHSPIMMPPGIRLRGVDVSLDVLDGCLCVVCTSRYRVVIWVMKEYGVRESWVKLLTISPPLIERNDIVKPLMYARDGARVLLNIDDKRLVWYDLGTNTGEEIVVEGLPFVFYAEACVESLVALDNGMDEVKKKVQRKEKKKEKIRSKRDDDFLSEGFKLVL